VNPDLPFVFPFYSEKTIFLKFDFLSGILIGSLPTFLIFYFSSQRYGIVEITSFFDFVKKQAKEILDFLI
tara:strand:- start:250 stop:459 length:210 start_codon:yes stop_codon:yes gene_type:complete